MNIDEYLSPVASNLALTNVIVNRLIKIYFPYEWTLASNLQVAFMASVLATFKVHVGSPVRACNAKEFTFPRLLVHGS
nr:hypothetical protein [Marinicella sp. W31]MDC2877347.1 hypothetical protein [Marinicella sp. W31]